MGVVSMSGRGFRSAASQVLFSGCDFLTSGWKSRDSVPKLVEDYLGGKLKVDEFVSHNFSLESINEAFTVMHEGKR